ncbi:TssQ family T6SS-associated lipoprotein [Delftia sp. PS-11]|uniref:TssQ family T6SS-associated lipoprotein n=1 Tax=Delftia sp. PS-11 TaxID=2767222 RepID=UPI00246342C7|nr:TssQ family T6SS-associated lipoprotein [Delftia sp. PS-11]
MSMHIPSSIRFLSASLVMAFGLAACQTPPPPAPEPAVAPVAPEPVKPVDPVVIKEQELVDAIQMYVDGRYENAINALTPLSTAQELPMSSQVKALKYIAFSHCVEGRRKPCRQHFDMALALDPSFQLTEAEKGHPVWGREFSNARAAALRSKKKPAPAPASTPARKAS